MRSLINELKIKWHYWRMTKAVERETRIHHADTMAALIKRRTPSQIKRMEQAKGL